MLYPLTFQPVLKERVWGGHALQRLYGKPVPPGKTIGESWELCDRPEAAGVIDQGALAGKDLRWAMQYHAAELLGSAPAIHGRFPWLVKLLDADQTLSVQVHPPEAIAARLGGEAKTELWYVAEARDGAAVFAGVKPGVTRETFAEALDRGQVADCIHKLPAHKGDVLFLPSGRVHALGAGLVIFEIQQNSDTTYRVFDWNRPGLDGKPRPLHVRESLDCIDFADHQPKLVQTPFSPEPGLRRQGLARHTFFQVDRVQAPPGPLPLRRAGTMQALGVIEGAVHVQTASCALEVLPGRFVLLPAIMEAVSLSAPLATRLLLVEPAQG